MDMRIINFIFAIVLFIAIMFLQTTQQQILFAVACIANVIALSENNIIEHLEQMEE